MDDTISVAPARALSARRRVGLALHAGAVLALVPAYLFLAPPSHWDDPVLLVALVALGVIANRSEVPLPSGITIDAIAPLALITVALAGPLPALAVIVAPIIVSTLTGRERLFRPGNLANLAAYGWYTLAGALLLQAAAPDITAPYALGWLVVAGIVQLGVNWALGPAIYLTSWLEHRPRTAVDVLLDGLPTGTVMVALGAITVVLTPALGLLALAAFALIVVLPQSALSFAARARPVARLDRGTAASRYAHAIAMQLGLSREERRHVRRVAALARRQPPTGDPLDYARATLRDPSPASHDVQFVHEWWNGKGRPIGLRNEAIPLAARVLAVADTWSALTARDTPELSHREALSHLEEAAGYRLDPSVVRAAEAVIAQERVTAAEPAPEPRLHHLRLPEPLRRALASGG
jgi:HD domain-containing protein